MQVSDNPMALPWDLSRQTQRSILPTLTEEHIVSLRTLQTVDS